MTAINFDSLIGDLEVKPSDTRLAEALCNSGQTQVKTLNLDGNKGWWKDPIIRASLLDFVKSQT